MARRKSYEDSPQKKRVRYMMMGGAILGGEHAPMYIKKKEKFKSAPLAGGSAAANIEDAFNIIGGGARLGYNLAVYPEKSWGAVKKGFKKDYKGSELESIQKHLTRKGTYGEAPDRIEDEIPYSDTESKYKYKQSSEREFLTGLYKGFTKPQTNMGAAEKPRPPKGIKQIPMRKVDYNEEQYKNISFPVERLKQRDKSDITSRLNAEIKPKSRFSLSNTFLDAPQMNMKAAEKPRPPKGIKSLPPRKSNFGELELKTLSFPVTKLKVKNKNAEIPRKKKGGK